MTLRNRTFAGTLAALASAVLLLSACTGSSGTQSSGKDAPDTLRLSSTTAPTSFALGYYGGGEIAIYTAIFDTLLTMEVDGKLTPGLAESWKYNDDLTQLTLNIRQGGKFSNGETVDAPAVAASLEAQRTGPATSSSWAGVKAIKAVDNRTVVMTFSAPNGAILPALSGIGGIVAAPSTLKTKKAATEPVGSGPYVLNLAQTQIGTRYVLEKNKDHWAADRYPFERVEYNTISDISAAANGLQSGQLDHVVGISPDQAKQLSGQFVTGVDNPTTFGVIWIADRAGKQLPPLADVRVRRAINMAFDRKAITEKLNPGVRHGMDQAFNPKGGAYLKEMEGHYPYDLEGARRLLAEAGYSDGFQVTMPSSLASADFEPVITQSLAEIGIKVKWETVSLQDVVAKIVAGDYPMFYFPSAWQASDAIDVGGFLGVFNPFHSMTPELEALLKTANASREPNAFAEVNRYFIENAWFAPLAHNTFHWAHSSSVKYTPPTVWGVSVRPWAPAG